MSQPEILEGRTAYVNGDFLPIAEARVSVLDRGFLYGDGLYETLNVANGRTFRLEAHLDRLFQSAAVLKITVPLSRDVLRDAIFATVERNALADAYVRILLSRGESHPIIDTRAAVRPATLVILVHSRQQPPEVASYFTGAGLNARIVSLRKIAPTALEPRVKSLNYLNSVAGPRRGDRSGRGRGHHAGLRRLRSRGSREQHLRPSRRDARHAPRDEHPRRRHERRDDRARARGRDSRSWSGT